MTSVRPLLLAIALTALGCSRPTNVFLTRSFTDADGTTAKYSLFVPKGYTPEKPVPVILFLHGAGEGGTDGVKPTQVGLGPAVRKRAEAFPFIVVFPQSPDQPPDTYWTWLPDNAGGARALAILDAVQRDFRTDPKRVYVTGISIGGTGVWHLAAAHPDRWAAIVPVCGVGPAEKADAIKHLPCWCFHGADDSAVPARHSRDMMDALGRAGGRARYTEYLKVGHNSWEKAYDSEELYEWLLEQRKR